MKRGMIIWLICLALTGSAFIATAETAEHPAKVLLDKTFATVIDILDSKEVPDSERVDAVIDTVAPLFDFNLMGKLTLGKENWIRFSKDQRETFLSRFETRLRTAYIDKIAGYTNETVSFGEIRDSGKKVSIPTTIATNDGGISIVYKLYLKKDEWRIYDVEIQNISLIQSYRTQFDSILKTGSPDELLEKMLELPDAGAKAAASAS